MSAAEGQHIAKMTIATLKSIRNDESYDLFWMTTTRKAELLNVDKPTLPRRRKAPKRYDDSLSTGDFHTTPKSFYKQQYYEALDLMINCVESRFD